MTDQPSIVGRIIEWLPDIGAGGLIVLVVWMILTGRLVPGSEMRHWREMAFEEQAQKRDLINSGKVTVEVLRSIPEAIEEDE